ncbi:YceH family protein [Vibrio sp. kj40-1]|uniref:YceH family protein n=1 Tax=Vibrio algarum TaxID=3020714 RepID=A0ABT4YX56_9VIBR|nr:YceH family protein [Vibrio sp. KJ40-1]MDB1126174.1 YceH family protein [Vibrio sp. KJ40-1]
MKIELSAIEARVIGCLLEKEATTPDLYPLTLNSLTNACNQKSNREPVMALSESEVLDAVDNLISKRMVSDESAFNSRVSKYRHRFCNTEFGDLQFTQQEKGVVCCFLLRGAQTPGELRTRTNRLCQFTDVKETESVLDTLSAGEAESAIVVKLPREPGKRESRYMHQFCGKVDVTAFTSVTANHHIGTDKRDSEKIQLLEEELDSLKKEVAELREMIEQFL